LAVIQASSDLLSQYFDRISAEKRLKYASEIQGQIKVLTDMMEEVLVINRAQSGKLRVSPAPLDLVGFCQTLFEDMQLIDTAQHDFVFAADGRFENIRMDEKLLRHILVNLFTNAIKYSPGGGSIRFELAARTEHIVFRISDQGIGIPEEDQQRLFEEFYRAGNTGQIAGTGLGLAIVKRSVEAHGGSMEVESKVGVGTTFTVHLPANFKLGAP
jgi:signal transduction histidine kinase